MPEPGVHTRPAHFRLMGAFRLSDGEGAVLAANSRRGRALLAYLVLTPDHVATRERLCGLLWGDRGEAQARASLRQCLLELRDALTPAGLDLIDRHRENVALRAGAFTSDVGRLVDSLDNGLGDQVRAALEPVGSARLLEDLEIGGAFRDWLDQTRARLDGAIGRGVLRRLERCEADDDWRGARDLAEAYLRRDSLDEAVVAAAIRADIATGNTTSAHRRYQQLQASLTKELGVPPGPLVRNALNFFPGPAADRPADQPNGAAEPASPTFFFESDKPSIAVLPFANLSGDPGQDYFVDGLVEEVVTSLTRIRTFFVIASDSSLSLKGQAVGALDAAKRLGVRYVLEGSMRMAVGRVRIVVRLIDATVGNQVWADRFEGGVDDIFALQDKVALGVAGVIEFSVQHVEALRSIKRPTSDLRSYDLYLRALIHLRTYSREDIFQALDMANRAIALDPDYALAQSIAACCYALILRFQWSDDPPRDRGLLVSLVDQSVRNGSDDPQVLASAALAYWTLGNVVAGAPLAERAAALNPGSSFALQVRGQLSVAMGNIEVAEDCLLRSMQLDPLSPNRNLQVGGLAAARFAQRRFSEAAGLCLEWVQISNSPASVGLLVACNAHLGLFDACREGIAHLRRLSTIPMIDIASLIYQRPEHRDLFMAGIAMTTDQPELARS